MMFRSRSCAAVVRNVNAWVLIQDLLDVWEYFSL